MDLHYIQIGILVELAKNNSLKYSRFEIHTEIANDKFNYHLQKLVKQQLIEKNSQNEYTITNSGKTLIGTYDFETGLKEKMPKVSILARIFSDKSKSKLLVSKRLKAPFRGANGLVTGKVRYGEDFETAMIRETQEETGLTPLIFKLVSVQRYTDFDSDTNKLVHDVVFFIFDVTEFEGELVKKSDESQNFWVDVKNLKDLNNKLPLLENMSKNWSPRSHKVDLELNTIFTKQF